LALGELRAGFEEHGWTGKLFLVECGLSIGGAMFWYAIGLVSLFALRAPGAIVPFAAGFVGLTTFVLLQWRYLLGIARFEKWAGLLAPAISMFVGLGSLVMLQAMIRMGHVRGIAAGLAQTALCVQYVVYFARSRDRFVTRRGRTEVLQPAE
jgi:hypothetical protein